MQQDYTTLNIFFLTTRVWRKRWWIFCVTLLSIVLTAVFTIFFVKPQYQSTTKVYILNQRDSSLTAGDLQLGSFLLRDYQEMILSSSVLDEVARQESLTANTLKSKISIQSPKDTRVLSISVLDEDPQRASDIANKIRETASKKIVAVTKIDDVTVLDEASPATSPTTPNVRKNIVLAGVVGLCLSVAYFVVIELLNDRVKNEEDVEQVLGMVLLGTVPKNTK